jgi:hypothetical protein
MEYWEIVADNLKKRGWSYGYVSAVDSQGRTIWIVDAHRGDGKRYIVHADEKLTAFLELESAIRRRTPNESLAGILTPVNDRCLPAAKRGRGEPKLRESPMLITVLAAEALSGWPSLRASVMLRISLCHHPHPHFQPDTQLSFSNVRKCDHRTGRTCER